MTKHRRPWIVVRKQKPDMPRPGQPMRWCAACHRCGRACMATAWGVVMAWAYVHPGHCAQVTLPAYVHIDPPNTPYDPFKRHLEPMRQRI